MSRQGCGGPILGCIVGVPVAICAGLFGGVWAGWKMLSGFHKWTVDRERKKRLPKVQTNGDVKEWPEMEVSEVEGRPRKTGGHTVHPALVRYQVNQVDIDVVVLVVDREFEGSWGWASAWEPTTTKLANRLVQQLYN